MTLPFEFRDPNSRPSRQASSRPLRSTFPDGTAKDGRFHVQIVAGANRENNGEVVWFRTVPDAEMLENILLNDNPNYVSLVFRGRRDARSKGQRHS